jgi:ribonuclease HI
VLLLSPHGDQFKYMVHLDFKETNNMTEYEALLFGLSTTLSLGVRQVLMKGDSQLIVKQVKGDCFCNDPYLAAYLLHTHKLGKDFELLDLQHIPRAKNAMTVTYQLRPPLRLWFRMECWKDDYGNLQLG